MSLLVNKGHEMRKMTVLVCTMIASLSAATAMADSDHTYACSNTTTMSTSWNGSAWVSNVTPGTGSFNLHIKIHNGRIFMERDGKDGNVCNNEFASHAIVGNMLPELSCTDYLTTITLSPKRLNGAVFDTLDSAGGTIRQVMTVTKPFTCTEVVK